MAERVVPISVSALSVALAQASVVSVGCISRCDLRHACQLMFGIRPNANRFVVRPSTCGNRMSHAQAKTDSMAIHEIDVMYSGRETPIIDLMQCVSRSVCPLLGIGFAHEQ